MVHKELEASSSLFNAENFPDFSATYINKLQAWSGATSYDPSSGYLSRQHQVLQNHDFMLPRRIGTSVLSVRQRHDRSPETLKIINDLNWYDSSLYKCRFHHYWRDELVGVDTVYYHVNPELSRKIRGFSENNTRNSRDNHQIRNYKARSAASLMSSLTFAPIILGSATAEFRFDNPSIWEGQPWLNAAGALLTGAAASIVNRAHKQKQIDNAIAQVVGLHPMIVSSPDSHRFYEFYTGHSSLDLMGGETPKEPIDKYIRQFTSKDTLSRYMSNQAIRDLISFDPEPDNFFTQFAVPLMKDASDDLQTLEDQVSVARHRIFTTLEFGVVDKKGYQESQEVVKEAKSNINLRFNSFLNEVEPRFDEAARESQFTAWEGHIAEFYALRQCDSDLARGFSAFMHDEILARKPDSPQDLAFVRALTKTANFILRPNGNPRDAVHIFVSLQHRFGAERSLKEWGLFRDTYFGDSPIYHDMPGPEEDDFAQLDP